MSPYTTTEEALVVVVSDVTGEDSGEANLPGTGSMLIHASYTGETERTPVNALDLQALGYTEEVIRDLEPGPLPFVLGDAGKTTLDGQWPYHITANRDYTFGVGLVEIVEAPEPTELRLTLEYAPQYVCGYVACEYSALTNEIPDTCGGPSVPDNPQWIYLSPDGVLHGSLTDRFGGQGYDGDTLSLGSSGGLSYQSDVLVASRTQFSSGGLSFSYILSHPVEQYAYKISCELQN